MRYRPCVTPLRKSNLYLVSKLGPAWVTGDFAGDFDLGLRRRCDRRVKTMGVANGGDSQGEDTTMVESNLDRYECGLFIGVCIDCIAAFSPVLTQPWPPTVGLTVSRRFPAFARPLVAVTFCQLAYELTSTWSACPEDLALPYGKPQTRKRG